MSLINGICYIIIGVLFAIALNEFILNPGVVRYMIKRWWADVING